MTVAVRACALAVSAALALASVGCSGDNGEEETRQASAPLDFAAKSAVVKRNVRLANPLTGCTPVVTPTGTWSGTSLGMPGGKSRVFCSYTWSSRTGAAPAETALDAIAALDGGVRSYVVHDRNNGTPLVDLDTLAFTTGGAGGAGGGGAVLNLGAAGAFTLGGAQQGSGQIGYTAGVGGNPEGFPGCEVCGEVIGQDWLFFVLPAAAVEAETVYLDVGGEAPYDLGAIGSSVFYTPIPAGFTGYFYVSW